MKRINKTHKFELAVSEKDMMLFCLIAAAKGLTPEMLLECFVHDIVSYFSSEAVSIEDDHLARWFFGSWFSDDEGYFGFTQYLLCTGHYKVVILMLDEIRKCIREISKAKNENDKQNWIFTRDYWKRSVKMFYREYCNVTPAHKSLLEEIRELHKFERKNKLCAKAAFKNLNVNEIIDRMKLREVEDEFDNNDVSTAALQ